MNQMNVAASDDLRSVLEVFAPVLRSIDFRTLAVRLLDSDPWSNLVTLVYISDKTPEEIQAEHESYPKVKNTEFAFFFKAVPFDLESLNETIAFPNKEIIFPTLQVFGNERIRHDIKVSIRKIDPLSFKVHADQRWIRGTIKSFFVAEDIDTNPVRNALWLVAQKQDFDAKRAGYAQSAGMINDILSFGSVNIMDNRDIIIVISTGIHILRAGFKNNSFETLLSPITGLKGLQLNFVLERTTTHGFYSPIWRTTCQVREEVKSASIDLVTIKTPMVLPNDRMSIELIHRSIPLTIDTFSATAPLENVIEPFLKTLGAFCPYEDFKKMLFEPQHYAKRPEKIFENAVAWLFSLAGYLVINLAPSKDQKSFESLRATESGFEIGSADLLAYEENEKLLLIDCDIGASFDSKIKMLVKGRNYLEKAIKPQVPLISVLCTPNEFSSQSESGVVIFDKNMLEGIFIEITKGDREDARKKIDGFVGRIGTTQT